MPDGLAKLFIPGHPSWTRSARFASMKGRAVVVEYVPIGHPVQARTAQELEANTSLEIARMTRGEPAN